MEGFLFPLLSNKDIVLSLKDLNSAGGIYGYYLIFVSGTKRHWFGNSNLPDVFF